MFRILFAFACLTSVNLCGEDIQHLDHLNVPNAFNAHFPNATEDRANKLIGLGYEALHAANTGNESALRGYLFKIKAEVESMMSAQIKFEAFIDDAFEQAAARGAHFSRNTINNVKIHFGIHPAHNAGLPNRFYAYQNMNNEFTVANMMGYQRYEDQKTYKAPPRLNAGISLVIIGSVMTVIPFPPCAAAGVFIAEAGLLCILDACITGCERQEGYR